MALTLGFGSNSVQAEDNHNLSRIRGEEQEFTNEVSITPAVRGYQFTPSTDASGRVRRFDAPEGVVSEGLDNYLSLRVNPSPENLTFTNSQVDFQPSPVGRGGIVTGFAAEGTLSLPSGENTNSASVSEARIVSEGLDTISLGGEKDLLTSEGEFSNSRGGYLALTGTTPTRNSDFRISSNRISTLTPTERGIATGFAAELKPTIDDLHAKASTVLPTLGKYTLTELTDSATAPDGTVEIGFNGKRYYYTPNETTTEKANMLSYLAGSMAVAYTTTGATSTNYLFTDGTNYYTIDTTKLPTSVYTVTTEGASASSYDIKTTDGTNSNYYNFDLNNNKITNNGLVTLSAGTSSNYDFQALKATSDGTIHADKYYNITIDPSKASHLGNKAAWSAQLTSAPSGYTWTNYNIAGSNVTVDTTAGTVTGAIRMKTLSSPNTWNRWYTYTYTKPSDYTITQTRLNDNVTADNVNKKVFAGINPNNPWGGAIYNTSNLSTVNIISDFVGNKAVYSSSSWDGNGGAIYNNGSSGMASIGSIVGDFVGNIAYNSSKGSYGGAISNYAKNGTASIGSIVGDFVGNSTYGANNAYGGAISNYVFIGNSDSTASIGSIVGDFVGNFAKAGGAISNYVCTGTGSIDSIVGNFVANFNPIYNYADSSTSNAIIGSIVGDFVGNVSYSISNISTSGTGSIGSIAGDFVGSGPIINHVSTSSGVSIGSIVGDFVACTIGAIENRVSASGVAQATIGSIVGDFIGNRHSTSYHTLSGAILNYATTNGTASIGSIVGDFIGNYAEKTSTSYKAYGGAIFNGYIAEYSSSSTPQYKAGAIITLSGNTFTGNYVNNNGTITPNGIYNAGVINIADGATVTVNDGWQSHADGQLVMLGNDSVLNMNIANGTIQADSLGKITNVGTINATVDIDTSDVSNPLADTITVSSVTQTGKINLTGLKFIGGSIDNFKNHLLTVQILKNTNASDDLQLALAGAMAETGEVVLQAGEKTSHSDTFTGTALWSDTYGTYDLSTDIVGTIGLATTDTTYDSIGVTVTGTKQNKSNIVSDGDTLKLANQYTTGGIGDDRTMNFTGIIADPTAQGTYKVTEDIGTTSAGTLTLNGETSGTTRSAIDFDGHSGFVMDKDATVTIKDMEVKNASALATATGSSTNNKIVLDNVNIHDNGTGITTFGDVDIKGNSTISDDITVLGANSKIDIDGTNEVTLDSKITGGAGKTLTLHDGTINLTDNAVISGVDTTVQDMELNLSDNASLAGLNATFNGTNTLNLKNENSLAGMNPTFNDTTTLNIANNSIGTLALGNVNLNGLLKMSIDADLANSKIDQLTATGATVGPNGAIEVQKINLLSPTTEQELSLLFTNNADLANIVSYTGDGEIVYSPIFKYTTTYEKKADGGYFKFALPSHGGGGNSGSPAASDFNPAVLATPVAAQGIAQVGMNHVFSQSFEHADGFMPLPETARMSAMRGNVYAINDVSTTEQILKNTGVSTDFNDNLDFNSGADTTYENKAIWVKPYTSFERINLHNGPKVDMISYGTLIGGDSDFRQLKNGWSNVGTLYLGYNGASMDYSGVDTTFNGGVLGITESFYKKNFFTAISANVGAGFAEAQTMYGHDDMTMLMAGIASKTGYNFEFKEGKFIIQPSLLLSYSMINTFDYRNSAGVKIDSDPLHTIQLNPNVKFIANLKHGWQPYASVGMVYNLMNETKVTANSVKLPECTTRPYVEYGIGVQKHFGETFSGYGQAMVRNGGRNGIALTAGFRWALGGKKAKKDNKNVNNNVLKDASAMPQHDVSSMVSRSDAPQEVVNTNSASKDSTLQSKAVVKSVKQNSKARNIARYEELLGE